LFKGSFQLIFAAPDNAIMAGATQEAQDNGDGCQFFIDNGCSGAYYL